MKESREKEIREIVRRQIIGALEADLENGESLMKEAFEKMLHKAELKACYAEMRAVIDAIKGMP